MERPSNAGPLYAGALGEPKVPAGVPKTVSQSTPVPAGTVVFAASCVQVLPRSVDL